MSNQISTAFVSQFSANVYTLVQQNGSKLRNSVMQDTVKGENAFYDQIGAVYASEKSGRHVDTPQIDTPHSRRRLDLSTYNWSDLIDNDDEVRMLIDPTSKYAQMAAKAMGRKIDEIIVDAMLGNAKSGHNGEESVSFDSDMVIAANNTGFTFDKLVEAKCLLDSNDVPEDDRFLVITSKQLEGLLKETKMTSSDYNTVKALVKGDIDSYMGFKFINVNGKRANGSLIVPATVAEGVTTRHCFAYSRQALMLGIGQNPFAKVTERPDKCYATQVYMEMSLGGVRMEEAAVVKVECKE